MDLNTALMESISEYFVATNTRTSFTELASDNGSSLQGNNSNSLGTNVQSTANLSQQFVQKGLTANPHHQMDVIHQHHHQHNHHHNQQHQQLQQQQQQQQHQHQHHHQVNNPGLHHHSTTSLQVGCNNNYQGSSSLFSSSTHNNNTSSISLQSATRLNQPVRTQIPIHCYIEQLDACADIPGEFNSTLNDNDLFNTVNPTPSTTTNNNNSSGTSNNKTLTHQNNNHNDQQNHHHPHLHQSKLALESVTNCNGPSSLASLNASSTGLFNENDTNTETNELDGIDSNLDHLSSDDSPHTIHQQSNSLPSNGSNILTGNGNTSNLSSRPSNQPSSSYDNHHFQTCRETYAIVTSNVLYIDLVRTVLLQLGYSAMDLINAKATIQIKNWRPLAMDQVTEDKRATVGEVLGDISTFVTLRIRLYSPVTQLPTEWTETMIRQVVLALTQTMSQLTLSKLCNISQPLISSIVRGGKKLGRRKCAEFGQWYMNYIKSAEARPSTMFCEGGGARLVFDKSREIPQLKDWFAGNTKPSDELLEEYSKILNEHALRKDRPQVTAKALKNWWKNERQKLGIRQREFRGRPKLKQID